MDSSIDDFIRGIDFRFIRPDQPPSRNYLRADYRLRRIGVPVGLLNAKFPVNAALITKSLWRLNGVQGMSTFALAGIINESVRRMAPGEAYVNVGTWQGFTLFAGMLGNPDRHCIGVDNFSEHTGAKWGPVRSRFLDRFARWRSDAHEFVELDYVEYFEKRHSAPIGVYLYDGEHSFENQLRALEVAERFFADNCLVLVDDAYGKGARDATEAFMEARPGRYEVVLDQPVASKGHPTFWNGFVIIRRRNRAAAEPGFGRSSL